MRYGLFVARVLVCAVLLGAVPQLARAEVSPDEVLERAVSKRLLEDRQFDAANIRVASRNGTVLLRGTMSNRSDRNALHKAALSVPGVKDVTMQVDVLHELR